MGDTRKVRAETTAVQAGFPEANLGSPQALPIYQTAAFAMGSYDDAAAVFAGQASAPIYSRTSNPTVDALEDRLVALEGGIAGCAHASGQAAVLNSILTLCKAGDNFIAASTIWGGSFTLFKNTLTQFGIEVRFATADQPKEIEQLTDDNTRLAFVETLGNPGLNVIDIEAWAKQAHENGLPLIVDNTAASPILCRPFDFGADVVVHSATKYLEGHGTAIGGVVVDSGNFPWAEHSARFAMLTQPDPAASGTVWTKSAGNKAYIERLRWVFLHTAGACMTPLNAFLIFNGISTAPIRMQRHSENALAIAEYATTRDEVTEVCYPGLHDAPEHDVAVRQMPAGYGGLVSIRLKGGPAACRVFIDTLQLFSHVANFGDVHSMVEHPALVTIDLLPEQMAASGMTPDLVRLSVGIEHIDDLLADIETALDAVANL